jgi:hypothetical protein
MRHPTSIKDSSIEDDVHGEYPEMSLLKAVLGVLPKTEPIETQATSQTPPPSNDLVTFHVGGDLDVTADSQGIEGKLETQVEAKLSWPHIRDVLAAISNFTSGHKRDNPK